MQDGSASAATRRPLLLTNAAAVVHDLAGLKSLLVPLGACLANALGNCRARRFVDLADELVGIADQDGLLVMRVWSRDDENAVGRWESDCCSSLASVSALCGGGLQLSKLQPASHSCCAFVLCFCTG